MKSIVNFGVNKAKPFLEANEYDFRDTEAVRHWKKVHEIEMRYRKQ